MRKIFKSVPFLSALACLSAIMCGMSWGDKDWVWTFIWGVAIPLDLYELRNAIYVHGGRYKRVLSACAAQSAIGSLTVAAMAYNVVINNPVMVAAWSPLFIFSVVLVYKQLKLFKRERALDQRIDNWMSTHFPEDKMGDITLERKR